MNLAGEVVSQYQLFPTSSYLVVAVKMQFGDTEEVIHKELEKKEEEKEKEE